MWSYIARQIDENGSTLIKLATSFFFPRSNLPSPYLEEATRQDFDGENPIPSKSRSEGRDDDAWKGGV